MLLKLSKKCPSVVIRRIDKDNRLVWIDGVQARQLSCQGDFSRQIFMGDKYVVKIDNYLEQSRNEAIVWSERLDKEDKKFFAETVGIGTVPSVRGAPQKRTWFVVQVRIDYDENDYPPKDSFPTLFKKYSLSDCDARQVKYDRKKKRVIIHDYGLSNFDQLSGLIPASHDGLKKMIRSSQKG